MDYKTMQFDERTKIIADKLDKLIDSKKLNFYANDSEVDAIFNMPAEDLFRLPHQKLSEYSYLLSRYGVYLQKELNKERGLLNWARRSLDYIVLPKLKEYRHGYMSNDEVKMCAIRDNELATKFWGFIVDKENEVGIISDLNFDIRKMSDHLGDIAKSKRFANA